MVSNCDGLFYRVMIIASSTAWYSIHTGDFNEDYLELIDKKIKFQDEI